MCILLEMLLVGVFFLYKNKEEVLERFRSLFFRITEYTGMLQMNDIPTRDFEYEPPQP